MIALTVLSLTVLACESLNIPPQPDITPVLEGYANPTASVNGDIMGEVAQAIEDLHDDAESSEFYQEVLDVIGDVQAELDASTDENGNFTLEGVGTYPAPSGAIGVSHTCPGWGSSDTNDPENGTIALTMTLVGGQIGALVWGPIDNCRYLVPGTDFEASFDGDIAVYLGGPIATSQPLDELQVLFVVLGTIGFEGATLSVDQAFRVTESGRFDILVVLDDKTNFVYSFEPDNAGQAITDAGGTLACNLESKECGTGSNSFSW